MAGVGAGQEAWRAAVHVIARGGHNPRLELVRVPPLYQAVFNFNFQQRLQFVLYES